MISKKKIAVLLSSYNGEKYIKEQIESVINQNNVNVELFIRDDGSTDSTLRVLEEFDDSRIHVFSCENVGVTNSFFSLLWDISDFDYYAFCDQDDVWDRDKLKIALDYLDDSNCRPALYFSSTRVVNENLNVIENKSSLIDDEVYDVTKVILSNNATGCTMVFNSLLREIIIKYKPEKTIMHDHWVYALCVLIGGKIYYDSVPHISYRQHNHNVLGNKVKINKKVNNSSLKNGKRLRSNIAKSIYENFNDFIPDCNKQILYLFAYYICNRKNKKNLLRRMMKTKIKTIRKIITVIEVMLGVL